MKLVLIALVWHCLAVAWAYQAVRTIAGSIGDFNYFLSCWPDLAYRIIPLAQWWWLPPVVYLAALDALRTRSDLSKVMVVVGVVLILAGMSVSLVGCLPFSCVATGALAI